MRIFDNCDLAISLIVCNLILRDINVIKQQTIVSVNLSALRKIGYVEFNRWFVFVSRNSFNLNLCRRCEKQDGCEK
ncbi:protein of unknown function [Vibrio tapetis subsp. tapetis]|uniref:Uncharacterized protein n=1 Tax=Vibrio tapetis subsp. tapetis TaxID=1671868 RepID=A0A2N8ZJM0_9VIBR|nr:protein of unknown function [Vibrio tapetis subsp. tapetis]